MVTAVDAGVRPDDPSYLKVAFSRLGMKEVPGARDNPLIVEMFARIGRNDIRDEETSWCACFVGWCLVEAGMPLSMLPARPERLLARAYLGFGRRLTEPVRGAVVIFRRGRSSWQGHVAFFLRFVVIEGVRYVECIGGNQSNAVTIARFHAESVLGFRAPEAVALTGEPCPVPPPAPPSKHAALGQAIGGAIVVSGTGGAVAAAGGVPWWAVAAGIALGLLGAGALIFFLNKRG